MIIFSAGFEEYGAKPDQRVEMSLNKDKPKARLKISQGSASITHDITPPADGKWYSVSQVIMIDKESGNIYTTSPPEIKPI